MKKKNWFEGKINTVEKKVLLAYYIWHFLQRHDIENYCALYTPNLRNETADCSITFEAKKRKHRHKREKA
jgi:hypothetical protein